MGGLPAQHGNQRDEGDEAVAAARLARRRVAQTDEGFEGHLDDVLPTLRCVLEDVKKQKSRHCCRP